MKRKFKSTLAIVLSVAVMFTFIPVMGGISFAASKPKAPKVTVTNVTGDSITLNWGGVKNAKSYVVYKKVGNKFKKAAKVTKKTATVKGLETGTAYSFIVKAAAKKNGKSLGKASKKIDAQTLSQEQVDTMDSTIVLDKRSSKGLPADKTCVPGGAILTEVDYTADYKLDRILSPEVQGEIKDVFDNSGLEDSAKMAPVCDILCRELGIDGTVNVAPATKEGCTAFAVKNNKGNQILGRNYDYTNAECAVEILHTPVNKESGVEHASVAFADLAQIEVTAKTAMTDEGKKIALLAPYLTKDGINDAGVAVSVFSVDEDYSTIAESDNPYLFNRFVTRVLLDKADSVDEAVEIIKSFNLTTMSGAYYGGYGYHWIITDSSGDAKIVEVVDGKVVVSDRNNVPNVSLFKDGSEGNGFNTEGVNFWWAGMPVEEMGMTRGATYGEPMRGAEDFLAITNFFIANDGDTDYTSKYNGEGVGRYEIVYDALKANPNPSNREAMGILQSAKFWTNCPDMIASANLYRALEQDPDTLDSLIDGVYLKTREDVIAYLEGEAYDCLYNWTTKWSSVYDTSMKKVDVCFCENYNKKITLGIEY